jgi:DNA repair protein REV1
VKELGTEVAKRLRQEGLKAGSLSLKVMVRHPDAPVDTPKLLGHGWVDTHTKNSILQEDGRKRSATDDPSLIAKTAWNLMKSLDAPSHELRGIGITLQKLEKDGQSVDVVREKGQSKLSFAAPQAPRPRSPDTISSASILPPADPAPPPAAQTSPEKSSSGSTTPEVIILDDSDSEEEPAVAAKPKSRLAKQVEQPSRLRSMSKETTKKEVYIPQQLFRTTKTNLGDPPSASQISADELLYYEIDPGFYESMTPEIRRDILADARKMKPRFVPKKNKQKARAKSPERPPMQDPVPSVLVLSPSSPHEPETKKLEPVFETTQYRNLPPDVLREILPALGPASQKHVLDQLRLLVPGVGHSTRNTSITRNAGPPQVDVRIRPEPQFAKMSNVDDIEERLEQWVTAGRDVLNEEDIERFGGYLEKCVMRDKGHNLSKAVELLRFWRMLLEDEFGKKDSIEVKGSGRAWWEGFERTFQRVDWVVWKETSCHLVL